MTRACHFVTFSWLSLLLALTAANAQLYNPEESPSPINTEQTAGPTASPSGQSLQGPSSKDRSKSSATASPIATASKPRAPYLSDLGGILNSSTRPLAVNLCFLQGGKITSTQLAEGAAITEALALRAGYRPLIVTHSPRLEPDKFNVVIGTVAEAKNLSSPQELSTIEHGFVALRKLDPAQNDYLLLMLGQTPEDIDETILSLGLVRIRYPDSPSALINEVIIPSAPPFYRQQPVQDDADQTFSQLKDDGVEFHALPGGGVSFDVFFPGYLRSDTEGEASLKIHFAARFGPLLSGHIVEAKLNGEPLLGTQNEVPATGNVMTFTFPLKQLQPGRNSFVVGTRNSGEALRVFSDSVLSIPKLPNDAKLPDLRLETRTFYPFIGQPDGSNLAVLLTEHDAGTIDSAWTLLAKLAQSANTFFYAAQFTYDAFDQDRNVLVIGSYDSLPATYRNLVTLNAFDEAHVNTPLAELEHAASGINLKTLIAGWLGQRGELKPIKKEEGLKQTADVQAHIDRDFGLIVSAPPPSPHSGWSMVVTALGPNNLVQEVNRLVQPAFWDQIRGDAIRWKDKPNTLEVHEPGKVKVQNNYIMVEFPLGERLDYRVWIGVVVGLLIFAVILSRLVLSKIDGLLMMREHGGY